MLTQQNAVFTIPNVFEALLEPFAHLFSARVWSHAQVLLWGAILSPAQRTVSAALRVLGLSEETHFINYHRVLSRAVWSSRQASKVLLLQLVAAFALSGTVVMGIDDTIERRRGKQIAAKGIYRDPVRSSHGHFVKASGLRWLSLMLLVPIPWAQRVWALPFFTVLAPSERYNQQHRQRHKGLIDWSRQMLKQVRRWLPLRSLIVVADSSFAALELLSALSRLPSPVHLVTRLRLDAALYEPAAVRQPKQMGRPRLKGKRLPTLAARLHHSGTEWQRVSLDHWYGSQTREVEVASATAVWYHTGLPPVPIRWVLVRDPRAQFQPQAFLCTDLATPPQQILTWFRQRWQLEVTFEEVRAHLGVETQRQWSSLAIVRTTPALLALFSIVVLWTHQLRHQEDFCLRSTAWYAKRLPTFVDTLAHIRLLYWDTQLFNTSHSNTEMIKVPRHLLDCWSDFLCYVA